MGEAAKSPRNSAIEMYRVILMGGIIMLHITGFQEFWSDWRHLTFLLLPCVDGFVLITGYFGTKFSLRKLCKLYATALWCIVLVSLLYHLIVGDLGGKFRALEEDNVYKTIILLPIKEIRDGEEESESDAFSSADTEQDDTIA